MRPTLLNYRSPNERTPEYYNIGVTHQGEPLHFRSKSLNKKQTNLPLAERFPQYRLYQNSSGLSCFVGPGTYNDHEDFIKMSAQPCSIKMVNLHIPQVYQKKISVLPEKEGGKPCYIMVGNNLKFESSFLSTRDQKREIEQLNTDQCNVYLRSILHKRSVSTIRERISNTLKSNNQSIAMNASFNLPASTQVAQGLRASNQINHQNQSKSAMASPEKRGDKAEIDGSFQTNANDGQQQIVIQEVYSQQQRPMTCQNCSSSFSRPQSNNQTMRLKNGSEFSNTMNFSSNMDKSTTLEYNSMKLIQEEGTSLPNIMSTPGQDGYISDENYVRIKSMLPKTALNYSKMKRGLYLNPIRGYPYNLKEEALARSINILQAYHEIIPVIHQKRTLKSQKGARSSSKRKMVRQSYLTESPNTYTPDELNQMSAGFGQAYMNIIRDSPQILNQREKLERQKREILNMRFESTASTRKKDSNQEMNKFLSDRYSQREGNGIAQPEDSKETKSFNGESNK